MLAIGNSDDTQVTQMPALSKATSTVSTAAHCAQVARTGRRSLVFAVPDGAAGQVEAWAVILDSGDAAAGGSNGMTEL